MSAGVATEADRLADVRRLHRDGVVANNAGHPLQALRTFRRALAALDRQDDGGSADGDALRARLRISASMSQSELEGLDAGLEALNEVVQYVRRTGDAAVAVHLHLQLGFMRVRGGQFRAGLDDLDAAARLIDYADPAAASNILLNRGALWLYQGELSRARADLSAAAARARAHGLVVEEAKARHNLGYLEYLSGNLADALRAMDDAAGLGADVSAAATTLDRARVLLEVGLHREADDALVEAIALFRRDRLWKDVGEVELARAECALMDGRISSARLLAARARDRFRRRGNQAWRRTATLVLLQSDLAAGRPGLRLARRALQLSAEFAAIGLQSQARAASLIATEALVDAHQPDRAAEVCAAIDVGLSDPISIRLHHRLVKARVASARLDRAGARRQIRRGLAELSSYQSRFGSIDLQTGSAVHGRRLSQLDVRMAFEEGRPAALLEAVERSRAASFRLLPVQAPSDDIAADLLTELRRAAESLRSAESSGQVTAQTDALRQRTVDIQRTLRERAWRADGSRTSTRPARAAEVRLAVAERGIALAFFVQVGDTLYAVVEGAPGGPALRILTTAGPVVEMTRRVRADLDALASGHLPSALADAVRASLTRALATLDDQLIRPLGIGDAPLLVIPTGELTTLAWGLLPSLRGRPVVVAPSATVWLAAATSPFGRGRPDVAIFAGPGLARADEEVNHVGQLWPGSRVVTADRAAQQELVAAMRDCDVVHVAAHGRHQAENPLFSSIRLGDGPVFAYELDQSARAAPHVILSACELGQATLRPGDEALGLTSVLLHLGSRSVIAGVARVHDDVAAEVMIRYHARLAAGQDSARALAEATVAVDGLPAPFVCFGSSWRTRPVVAPTVGRR